MISQPLLLWWQMTLKNYTFRLKIGQDLFEEIKASASYKRESAEGLVTQK